jgi:hypothetical protein
MASGEKREAGWDELFFTIWETAVQNDYEDAVKRLTEYAYRKAYDDYSVEVVKPLKHNSKELRAVKKAIREQVKMLCERLLPRIKELVYAESKDWPNNRYVLSEINLFICSSPNTGRDSEYNKIFNELKKEAVVFAIGEMSELIAGDEV